ncbi:MAG: RlmF-related methyltransferase, partial [Neisseriaceae bacterium]|nr:RlmF-related methyltransferase [Neisseriaceae bacterium]
MAKTSLHPRNAHQGRYDLPALVAGTPELAPFVAPNKYGDLSVDFNNPLAVVALNQALLAQQYGVGCWHLPPLYLCPPIPGRADYIHYVADLLAEDQPQGQVPMGPQIKLFDVGVGASAIYPLLGHAIYGWS